MGLTDQRQTAKNITDYRQNAKKNYRLQAGKLLTDYRHGPTLSIFFQKEEYIVFFLPFQEVTKDTTSQVFLNHKTRILKSKRQSVCQKFLQPAQSYTLHARNAQINPQRKFIPVQWKALSTNPPYRDGHKDSSFLCQHFHVIQ